MDRPEGELLRRAYGLMGRLRDCGFSSTDISSLVGGRWGDSAVRRFGKGSGVVDVSGRDELLRMVGEFASVGGDLEELGRYRAVNVALGGAGLDWDGAAKLAKDLVKCHGSVEGVAELSSKLAGDRRTVREVSQRIDLDKELERAGLTRGVQLRLLKAAMVYGKPSEILGAIGQYDGVRELQLTDTKLAAEVKRLREEIGGLRDEKEILESEVSRRRKIFMAADAAVIAGFDVASLMMIGVLAKDLGGPYKVVSAIQKYLSLKVIDDKLEAKKAELERVKRDTGDSQSYLAALKFTIGEAEKVYKENSDVRLVVELLRNPRGIKQDRPVMASLLARVLENGAQRVEESPWISPLPDADWERAIADTRALADKLRTIAKPKAEEPSTDSSL